MLAQEREFQDHGGMLMDHGGGHLMDMGGGMVMGQNTDTLPGGCTSISRDKEITIRGGHKYSKKFPGTIFAFDKQELQLEPCIRLTINFVNEDNVRHQFMVHGLPKYLYPKGMFHLEVTGPGKISGTLILPPEDKTYLAHCDIAQHMEKGMKAQIKVGAGSGDLPSIPGLTDYVFPDDYSGGPASTTTGAEAAPAGEAAPESAPLVSGMLVIGLAIGLIGAAYAGRKFKGMSGIEILGYLAGRLHALGAGLMKWVMWLIRQISSAKGDKTIPEK